jgi:hypothetical protein
VAWEAGQRPTRTASVNALGSRSSTMESSGRSDVFFFFFPGALAEALPPPVPLRELLWPHLANACLANESFAQPRDDA